LFFKIVLNKKKKKKKYIIIIINKEIISLNIKTFPKKTLSIEENNPI
jgi:hypothetical protein